MRSGGDAATVTSDFKSLTYSRIGRVDSQVISPLLSSNRFMHFEEEDIPLISGTGEAFMDVPGTPASGTRRDEDIALDLMKFIAMTTGYGKTTSGTGGV